MISAMEQRVRHYWTLRSHDFGAVRKNELENEMGQKWLREIERLLPEKEHLRILDVGTGTGFFAVLLAQTGHQVEGIDLTPAMLEEARSLAAQRNLDIVFREMDAQALSYAEIKALCAGNPLIKEKMDLDVQVAKLKVLKADHQSQKFRLEDKLLTKFPADIRETNAYIAGVKADAQLAAAHPQVQEGFCGMTIRGVTYDEKKTAGERLVLACSELPNAEEKVIGSYRGFELSLRFDTFRSEYQAILKGQRRYPVALGTDPLGNIIRLDNSLNNFLERINSAENELATLHQQQAAAQIEVEKPFPQEEELTEKSARLAELNAQLDVDEKNHEPEQDEEEQEDPPRRPSVLAALEEKSDKPEPVKPFRSYYDKDGDAR